MTLYLVKYISEAGRYEVLKPAADAVTVAGVILGLGTNIVTVAGVNSLTAAITEVSGASSLRDDAQDLALQSVSGTLFSRINSVSGASSLRDDSQDLVVQSVSGSLFSRINSVSGASSLRDDSQDLVVQSVSGTLLARINSVSGASSLRDDSQDAAAQQVSGALQGQINAIVADRAREERFEAVSGQTLFTLSMIEFDPAPTVRDAQVFKNGVKMFQSLAGSVSGTVSGGDFTKSATQVQFLYPLQDGDRVIVRDERTGGGGGGAVDLGNLTQDLSPSTGGGVSLGTVLKPFAFVRLLDQTSGLTWRLEVVSGAFQVTQE